MQAGRALSRRKQPGNVRHLGVTVNPHSTHHVMGGRADFHRLLRYVNVGKLFELVIHARQLFLDALRCVRNFLFNPCDIEEHTAMWTAATFPHLAPDTTGNVVARQQFRRTFSVFVALRVAPAFLLGTRSLVHI